MIDPCNFPRYDMTTSELEEAVLFMVAVAGKRATTTAKKLNTFLLDSDWTGLPTSPFDILRKVYKHPNEISIALRRVGIGCHVMKGTAFYILSRLINLDLKTCTVQDLMNVYGIGPKTARFFILHTRPGAQVACLDTHILKYLATLGHRVPASTPTGRKYLELEAVFLERADQLGKTPAELDIEIWKQYSGANDEAC